MRILPTKIRRKNGFKIDFSAGQQTGTTQKRLLEPFKPWKKKKRKKKKKASFKPCKNKQKRERKAVWNPSKRKIVKEQKKKSVCILETM